MRSWNFLLSLAFVAAFTGCESDDKLSVHNATPTAVITSHADGASVPEASTVLFVGVVTDETNPPEELNARWMINGEEACAEAPPEADGTTICEVEITAISTVGVRLEVRDPRNATATADIELTIEETQAPAVSLLQPTGLDTYLEDAPISFAAAVTDAEDTPAELEIWFESSQDGRIDISGTPDSGGGISGSINLTAGDHDLTLWAQDTDGKTGSSSVTLTVESVTDNPPTVELMTPIAGDPYYSDRLITLTAVAHDDEDDDATLTAVWTSSLDVDLAVEAPVTSDGSIETFTNLTQGEHVVTVTVTDSAGQTANDTVIVSVGAPNTVPECSIATPLEGAVFALGDTIAFSGTATDADVDAETLSIAWSEDGTLLDETPATDEGTIGFETDALTVGDHLITLVVTDDLGENCETEVNIGVRNAPTIAILNPIDGDVYPDATDIDFQIEVDDVEDALDTLMVTLTSDLDETLWMDPADEEGMVAFTTATLSLGEHTLLATVTDSHGLSATTEQIVVVNGLASAPVVEIAPTDPLTGEGLVAIIVEDSVDPDDPETEITYSYAWAVDGVDVGEITDSIDASMTAKGESWSVTVTPFDGVSDGLSGTADTEIGNTAPELTSVRISPDTPDAGSTLVCVPEGESDADGDAVSFVYGWTINGLPSAESTDTLVSGFTAGDVVSCTATAFDGTDEGEPVESATVTIGNGAPSIATVSISPSTPVVGDLLVCEWSGFSDPEGGFDLSSISWTVDGVELGTSALLFSGFAGGDTVVCTVTPYDGTTTGEPVSASVMVGNTVPTIASVYISPSSPSSDDTLTCGYTGFTDVDGDADASVVRWYIGEFFAGTGSTLGGGYRGGDSVTCEVTPFDGMGMGDPMSTTTIIGNTAPSVASATISPSSAVAGSTLSCTYSGFSDADDDADLSTITWSVDGSEVGTGPVIDSGFVGGDELVCTVTPFDGVDEGTPVTDSLTVGNTAPAITSVSISPSSPGADDTLVCSYAGYTDADDDADSSTIRWFVEGDLVGAGPELSSGFDGDDEVTCEVTPFDGTDEGEPKSASITIGNSAPSIASVSISPTSPSVSDTLTCSYSGYSDGDGDADESRMAWTVDGVVMGTDTTLTGAFSGGDEVVCTVTPSDGISDGTPVSTSVTVGNTPPSIASVAISPTSPSATDTLICSYAGYSDDDGDVDASIISWSVSGTEVGTGPSISDGFGGGDTVTCTVTPYDGTEAGTPLTSSVVVGNTAPSIASVSILPSTPSTSDALICSYTGFVDADDDPDLSTYEWTIDGAVVGSSAALVSGYSGGDAVTCTVTPYDGMSEGTPRSASVTIENTIPSVAAVSISPSSPTGSDPLTCTYSGFYDADGDADESIVRWYIDGSSAGTGSTLAGGYTRDDTVSCEVTPYDGSDFGTPKSASVTIGNATPTIASVSITPASPAASDTLTCIYVGYSDPDGDADDSAISWSVGGSEVGTGPTLSSGFEASDTVTCTVTPSDGTAYGIPRTASVTIGNTAPTIASVSISPSDPSSSDTLSCSYAGFYDADGDADVSTYEWSVDGSVVSTGATLSGGFYGGDTVTCSVTPYDGLSTGSPKSASVTIGNEAPSIVSVTISPSDAVASDTLSCSYSGFYDADGDADVSTYRWSIDGVIAGSGATLSGSFDRDDTVTCTVTPSDGTDEGASRSTSITIGNTEPSIAAVTISPESPGIDDTLTCAYSGYSDADGDTDASTYAWSVSGVSIGTGESVSSGFDSGDIVICTVTPSDGTDDGTPLTASAVVGNTAPSIASVSIVPETASTGDTLFCTYSGFSDPDGDPDASTYSWTVDGDVIGTGATVSSGFAGGDTVTCTVTPYDGVSEGDGVSDSITIDNEAPSIDSVAITPSSASAGDTLTCTYSGFYDADDDDDASILRWYVDGVIAGTGSTLSSGFSRGDEVTCTVTPFDGSDEGDSLSDTITIENSAPSVAAVSISPASPTGEDTLTCSYSGFSDADGDADDSSISWTVSGSEVGTGSTLSSGFDGGDTVICTVTPSDGVDEGTPVTDSVTIGNTAPEVVSVTLTPASVYTEDTVTATVTTSDADGDSVSVSYVWKVDGAVVSGETGATLDGSDHFDKGETITVVVTPTDGSTEGDSMTSDGVTVLNTAPTEPDVDMSPDDATDSDDLVCEVSSDSTDADGDAISYSIGWTVDDADYDGSTSTTTVSGDTVPSSAVSEGETWTCSVTPNDGEDNGEAGTASVTIDGGGMPNDLWDNNAIIVDDFADTFLLGEQASDHLGAYGAVTARADFDGDGLDDVLVSASYANPDDEGNAGAVYIVLGSSIAAAEGNIDMSAADYALVGENNSDHCGRSADFVDDLSGDGRPEILIGCPYGDEGNPNAGTAYLVHSETLLDEDDWLDENFILQDEADIQLRGTGSDDYCGSAVGNIGDYDGDGQGDFFVACEYDDELGVSNNGSVFVYSGGGLPAGFTSDIDAYDSHHISHSVASANLGADARQNVDGPGDIDGDGMDDLLLSTVSGSESNRSYVLLSGTLASRSTTDLKTQFDHRFTSTGNYGVASVGDIDRDGLVDIGFNHDGRLKIVLAAGLSPLGEDGSIDSLNDYTLLMRTGGSNIIYSVSSGDVDGDGYPDILISNGYEDGYRTDAGAAALFLGKNLATEDYYTADFLFHGDGDYKYLGIHGHSIAIDGDINGDGRDDILLSLKHDSRSHASAGSIAYIDATALDEPGYVHNLVYEPYLLAYASNDYGARTVAFAGDVDGDDKGDVVIAAHQAGDEDEGWVFLTGGTYAGASRHLWDNGGHTWVFQGEEDGDFAGYSVASNGDFDGDGQTDLLIGAPYNDETAAEAGRVYLFSGEDISALSKTTYHPVDDSTHHFAGEALYDQLGHSVAFAGDVDGDDLSDILLGAPYNDDGLGNAGKVYLFLGSSIDGSAEIDLADADYMFVGSTVGDNFGYSMSSAGDIDGDDLDDFAITAYGSDLGGTSSGAIYIFLAADLPETGTTLEADDAHLVLIGESNLDYAGMSLDSAGDIDGDGQDDLLIGAAYNDTIGSSSGVGYVLFGETLETGGELDLSESDIVFVGETAGDLAGNGIAAAGDVDGDGLADVIVGAPGHDWWKTDSGMAYLFLGATLSDDKASYDLGAYEYDHAFAGDGAQDMGSAVAGGDINGDGLSDLIIGGPGYDTDRGHARIVFSEY